jgi:uncharacterized membrane protein YedE/YeeE
MSVTMTQSESDKSVVLLTLFGVLAISLFVQHEFSIRQSILFLTGIGLGITLYHAAFGFSGSWRKFIRTRRGASARAQVFLLAATSILFFPLIAKVFPGINVAGAIAPFGISVLVGAFLFGIGMQLGGGCGSGTLFTVGSGNTKMLVTLAFFIIGATVGSLHLPWWLALPSQGKISLIEQMGWLPGLLLQLVVLAGLYYLIRFIEKQRYGNVQHLLSHEPQAPFLDRLVFGPWPVWWGVIGLVMFNLVTMLVAGHPWTIVFAMGLWGAKIWAALGGDVANWAYWSSGYPARALANSVLEDTTSLMDFGLILGAVLAAALAGKFAPERKFRLNEVITAVIGGLLLGYGARLAFGCNIGALLAGISSGSLHGWLWLVSGFVGNIAGVYLRIAFKLDSPVGKRS